MYLGVCLDNAMTLEKKPSWELRSCVPWNVLFLESWMLAKASQVHNTTVNRATLHHNSEPM